MIKKILLNLLGIILTVTLIMFVCFFVLDVLHGLGFIQLEGSHYVDMVDTFVGVIRG